RSQRIHPQTIHAGSGQRARPARAGTMTMKPFAETSLPAAVFDRATWTPLLDLSAREVFDIMLGTRLQPFESSADESTALANDGEFTALVGLAGSLCGVLSIRCNNQAA